MNDLSHTPAGYYKTTRDWATTLEKQHALKLFKEFSLGRTNFKSKAKGIEPCRWTFMPQPPRQFLAIVPWGRVWGINGSVIAPDNKLLWDVSYEFNRSVDKHSLFFEKTLPPVTYTSKTLAVVTAQCSFNYFHWMFDVLARIAFLGQASIKFDQFVLNRGKYYLQKYCKFQDESLELLGIAKEKLVECDKQTHIQAKQLIVSSMAGYTAYVPKSVCELLRREFLEKNNFMKQEGYERIYVSREDALHRNVLNEVDVFNVLAEHGFKMVKLSQMSFTEKIQLFHSAEVIVSPHGASLSNLIFCNPGVKVIEFFSPTYVLPCFYIISDHMNLDYYYLVGEKVIDQHDRMVHRDPILISLEKLPRILKMAGIDS